MSDMSHFANTFNGADVQVFNALSSVDFQTWLRPRGKSMFSILMIGSGAGGGGGFSRTAGTAGGGGGGGGSGAITRYMAPLLDIDKLYLNVPVGGLGGAPGVAGSPAVTGVVSLAQNLAAVNALVGQGSVATAGGAGSAAAAGAAGAAGTLSAPFSQAFLGTFTSTAGNAGLIGGAQTGAVGASFTWAGLPLTGGMGGAGSTTTDFAGGGIIGAGWAPSLGGGLAAGGRGNDGWFSRWPFGSFGGTGGGSNNAGTAGDGGNGAIGCGGGGGGAGTTGGSGGRGGNGLVIISCW